MIFMSSKEQETCPFIHGILKDYILFGLEKVYYVEEGPLLAESL